MPLTVYADHILLDQSWSTPQQVIRAIGEVMLAAGEVTARYVEGMLEKENQYSTWVTEGVALPHGTHEVRNEVLKNSLVVVQIPKGVSWDSGKTIYLAIGFAGQGDEQHLQLMSALAGVLQHREWIDRLIHTRERDEVICIMAGGGSPARAGGGE